MDKEIERADKPYTQSDEAAVLDCPELTDEQIATARPFAEIFPEFFRKRVPLDSATISQRDPLEIQGIPRRRSKDQF
ncbi:hypothetical protein [uncultured Sphingomonas sp.]|uniref:hypothetical protein n=1 Tax=uncultured Sphingomonas sp. TaxID=158754 RepID=UPI0025EC1543|nr:hypothetical protein [uncultured Sphingomonas sp.]